MTSEKSSKINKLLKKWPSGTVAVSRWLEQQGAYQQLVHAYEKTSWLRRIGQGAYAKSADKVEWPGGLYALQEQLRLPVHAGGKTALQMWGYIHFLPLGTGVTVSLFGLPDTRLPAWFAQYRWDSKIRYTTTSLFAGDPAVGLTQQEMGTFAVRISMPERAMLEVLYFVPKEESYEEAKLLMEGLTTLRPRLVQTLLEHCASVKVKRLFMVLAESCQHAWVTKLDLSKVNFGKGKRMIVKGGQFDPKYNICVPPHGDQREKKASPAKLGATATQALSSLRQVADKVQGDSDMTISQAIQEKRDMVLALAARHGARNVRLFGSVSRDEAGPQSDVDILVDLEPGRSLFDLGGLLMDLEDLLGRKVDVVTEKGLHWYIRDKVLKEAVRL
jgi:predicted nucleotidyltransferase